MVKIHVPIHHDHVLSMSVPIFVSVSLSMSGLMSQSVSCLCACACVCPENRKKYRLHGVAGTADFHLVVSLTRLNFGLAASLTLQCH